jgi:hypothetical protein
MSKVTVTREELPMRYREIIAQNPLLARLEGETRGLGWTDVEIRTLQLLVACHSNASLKERLESLEDSFKRRTKEAGG